MGRPPGSKNKGAVETSPWDDAKLVAAESPQTTALTNWREELASQAQIAKGMEEGSAGGSFFSLKSNQLSFQGTPVPDNQMAVVILDSVLENVFYEGAYSAGEVQAPTCFAFARAEKGMAPHRLVVEAGNAQHATCNGCPQNEWGSGTGAGKACRNCRRIAMIAAGSLDKAGRFTPFEEASDLETAVLGYLRLPPTSVKGYASFVTQVANAQGVPPWGIFTRVRVVPDPKSMIKVTFESLGRIPDEFMPVIMERHKATEAAIDFPYPIAEPREDQASRGKPQPAAARRPSKF